MTDAERIKEVSLNHTKLSGRAEAELEVVHEAYLRDMPFLLDYVRRLQKAALQTVKSKNDHIAQQTRVIGELRKQLADVKEVTLTICDSRVTARDIIIFVDRTESTVERLIDQTE